MTLPGPAAATLAFLQERIQQINAVRAPPVMGFLVGRETARALGAVPRSEEELWVVEGRETLDVGLFLDDDVLADLAAASPPVPGSRASRRPPRASPTSSTWPRVPGRTAPSRCSSSRRRPSWTSSRCSPFRPGVPGPGAGGAPRPPCAAASSSGCTTTRTCPMPRSPGTGRRTAWRRATPAGWREGSSREATGRG
jgi:hypothetical protein